MTIGVLASNVDYSFLRDRLAVGNVRERFQWPEDSNGLFFLVSQLLSC